MSMRPRDWWVSSVIIKSTNNAFRIIELSGGGGSPVVYTVTIPAGEYWLHRDTTYHSALPSLYRAIELALALTAASNGYQFGPDTPTNSPMAFGAGLRFGINSTVAFSVDAGNAGFTMDPTWFGWTAATQTAVIDGSSIYNVTSPHCVSGIHRTVHDMGGGASRKRGFGMRKVNVSHDDPQDQYWQVWRKRRHRQFLYQYVPSAALHKRNADGGGGYHEQAERGTGDDGGTFEDVWDALASGRETIVVHDCDVWDLTLASQKAELVRLKDIRSAEDFAQVAREMRSVGGEYYELSVDVWVLDSTLPGYEY